MAEQLSLHPHVRKLLRKGIAHQQAGRTERAAACYQRSLKTNPRCPQALHLMGLVAQQRGRYQEASDWLERALALAPHDADTLNSLAESYCSQGRIPLACQCLQRVAELLPRSAEARNRLGKVQERLRDWAAAEASYRAALALEPDSPGLYRSLAGLQYQQGVYREAVATCRRVLTLDPNHSETFTLLGNAFTDLGNWASAVEAHRQALALTPKSAYAVFGLGYFFERKGDFDSAAESYRTVARIDPQFADAPLHLGIVHILRGELGEAEECFQRALVLLPDSAEARSFLGLIHLTQGRFAEGWSEYEERRNTPQFLREGREFSQPLWKGEPLDGARILLHAEQGLGDTLHFVRYVPMVAARGGRVVLEVPHRLRRLLAPTSGAEEVISRGEGLPQFDWQCPLLSLPGAFATDLHSIPARLPYVFPQPAQAEAWRQKLSENTARIGLTWAGSPLHPYDAWRSIPLEALAPLTKLEGATVYSLQMGAPAAALKQPGSGTQGGMVDLQDEQQDFADAAAIVANLDLVVSVDTSIAHLAGAMGKPVWILLSKAADWRWMLERETSPWYPTARLFRQSAPGDWQAVVARVETELRKWLARARAG